MKPFPDPRWQSVNEQMRELVGGRELGSIPLPQRYKALPVEPPNECEKVFERLQAMEPDDLRDFVDAFNGPTASEISRTLAFLEQEKES